MCNTKHLKLKLNACRRPRIPVECSDGPADLLHSPGLARVGDAAGIAREDGNMGGNMVLREGQRRMCASLLTMIPGAVQCEMWNAQCVIAVRG